MAAEAEFTISSLADESGVTVRTLRDYSARGLLPPPEMRGRTGLYGEEHLNRVRIIGRLLERGITLNGVRSLLEAWDRGDDLADVLGVAAPAPSAAPKPIHMVTEKTIAATDLTQRFHDAPDNLRRLVTAGVFEPIDATTYRVANNDLAELLEQLIADGIPTAAALDEIEQLRADCDHIARKFIDLFEQTSVRPFRRSRRTPDDIDRLTERMADTRTRPGRVATALIDEFVSHHLAYIVARDLNIMHPGRP